MRSHSYRDIFGNSPSPAAKTRREWSARLGDVLEDSRSDFCGAIIGIERDHVVVEDRHGRQRAFPYEFPSLLLDGQPILLTAPHANTATTPAARTASGSRPVTDHRARIAQPSRIWVEGIHDAELIERIWGHDLRAEGVVVEPLHGIDDLQHRINEFRPSQQSRIGVLVDHLVPGSKESRIIDSINNPNVLITGHPYIDVWQAVRPSAIGLSAWPVVPKGTPWKDGVCAVLNWENSPSAWQRVLSGVSSYRDVETPLITAVEQLIDFVTVPGTTG